MVEVSPTSNYLADVVESTQKKTLELIFPTL